LLDDGPFPRPSGVQQTVDVTEVDAPDPYGVEGGHRRARLRVDQGERAVVEENREGVAVRLEGLGRDFAQLLRQRPHLFADGPQGPYEIRFVELTPGLGAGARQLRGKAVTVFFPDSLAHLPSPFAILLIVDAHIRCGKRRNGEPGRQ
jgi:hypothetical protein